MKIIINENQYRLILESKELVASFDRAVSDLAEVKYESAGIFNIGTENRPWWAILILDKTKKKEVLKSIKNWKDDNDVSIIVNDENTLKNSTNKRGLPLYNEIKYSKIVNWNETSSKFQNPYLMTVFVSPKKKQVDISGKDFYHSSEIPNLDKIGLMPTPTAKYKKNIYFWDNIRTARFYGANNSVNEFYIYKVNLDGYDVYDDPEEIWGAYFVDKPISPKRVELYESHTKYDEDKVSKLEKIKKSVEEKIEKYKITYSSSLPYVKHFAEQFGCDDFDSADDYADEVVELASKKLIDKLSEVSDSHFVREVNELFIKWFSLKLVAGFEEECLDSYMDEPDE